mgnify:CR=1 FL=1
MTYLLFFLGFVILIKGGDWLVSGSTSIAKRYGLSDMVVGLTIVSFGTSAPELVVNVISSLSGSSEIAIGNVIGSNISNILLIIGTTAIICDLPIKRNTLLSEIPFSLSAAVLIGFLANAALFDSKSNLLISRGDGAILLFFFVLFLAYVFRIANEQGEPPNADEIKELPMKRSLMLVGGGMLALFVGGKWVVDGAIVLARMVGMSETFIGLTVIAIGTSLPELVTSIVAASKKNVDIAVGNAIGSNIFNVLWILGISAIIKPLPFAVVNNTDILVLIVSSSLLILSLATGKRNAIDRNDGILFVVLYAAYTAFCIYRG